MGTRAWWITMALAVAAAACGDQPTEVVPEREAIGPGPGGVALATSSTEDGLSITTDLDDYAPGDTVWFTGAGWPANDVLDIVLTDDPTHDTHQWTVEVGEDGTFRDSTYVVDLADLGVTFTLTATSRATGRDLSVQFTDAPREYSLTIAPPTAQPNAPATSFTLTLRNVSSTGGVRPIGSANVAVPAGFTAVTLGTLTTPSGKTWTRTLNGTTIELRASSDASRLSPPSGATAGEQLTLALTATTPVNSGTYTWNAQVKEGRTFPTTGNESALFDLIPPPATVTIPGAVKLAFATAAFTRGVGECSPEIRVQTQNAANTPTNPSSSVTVNLSTSSSGGSFYSDAACSAGSEITTRTIPSGANLTSFYYRDSEAGAPTLTAADAAVADPLISATQAVTIDPPPGPNKLAFITGAFTRDVGECSPEIKVQSQNASGAPVNPLAAVTIALTSSSTGAAFYSDAACSAASAITSAVLPASGNTVSFYYRDAKAGTPTLTAADAAPSNPLAAATQQETIEKATPGFSQLSALTITYGDGPTLLGGTIAAGSAIPGGSVAITLHGVTKQATIGPDGDFSESFATEALGVAGSPYAITYGFEGDDDFNGVGGTGSLVVEKATPVFAELSAPTITYGDTPTSLSGKISKGTLVPTGSVSVTLDGATQQASIAAGGTFAVSFTTSGLGVAGSPYTITYAYPGDANFHAAGPDATRRLTVVPAPLAVTADDQRKDYDGHPFTGFTVKYSGFVNHEDPAALGGTLTFGGSAVGAVDAGDYTIEPDGLTSTNYEIAFHDGTLIIDKIELAVAAVSRAKVWDGQPYPFGTDRHTSTDVTYAGFVNDEGPSVLTGPLTFTAAATIATGSYENVPGGLSATNYTFRYVAGTLTIQS